MWKNGLVAAFHGRTPSLKAQRAPLVSSRPFSTATLDPVQEQETNDEQLDQIPETINNHVVTMPAIRDEKAAPPSVPNHNNSDIESNDSSSMRSIRTVLMEEIDTAQASAPLSAYCFMTGFMCVFLGSHPFRSPRHCLAVTQCAFLQYMFGVPSRQAILSKYVTPSVTRSSFADVSHSSRWP